MKHPPGGQLYRYRIKSIPSAEVTPEAKQQALCGVVGSLAEKPFKPPRPPRFKSDTFDTQRIPGTTLPIPIAWTLIDRKWLRPGPGHAPPLEDRVPEDHQGWDDDIGTGDCISGVPGCGPTLTWIAQTFMTAMIPAFDAYRADVEPVELADIDLANPVGLEAWRHYRWKVFGITAISFFDDRLCASAFGTDADTVAKRVINEVPFVSVLQLRNRRGVLIQAFEDYVDVAHLLPIRARIMAAIRQNKV